MEFIPDAEPITDHAQRRKLTVREKLELFNQVCDAVHHGHQKGIIHRDLKPDNILVGSDGQPKIIDFGVARSTDADVAITTMRTDVGQLIGTPQYMGPEQCAGDPNDIDMRSDVFCLGVILYQLLCGQMPYDVAAVPIFEATRIIREHNPARPSTIDRTLRGDLETIVLTALEKDRDKRYQSVADLYRDIRKYLNREPIDARPPTLALRVLRYAARHPVVSTTGICLFIAAAVVASTAVVVQLYNNRPNKIELVDNGREARLLAYSGRSIKTWDCEQDSGASISTAHLVTEPDVLSGKRIVLLGFSNAHRASKYPASLCAFDASRNLETPLWVRHIETSDIPVVLIDKRGYTGREFNVTRGAVADVFCEFPGVEVIAIHQHYSTTHSAIRIYDLRGRLLYQVWVDAFIQDIYWMSGARLLVFAGANGAAYWWQRGYRDVERPHAWIVFAVRPEAGLISRDYLAETPADDSLSPAWYKCLLPPPMTDVFGIAPMGLVRPSSKYDPDHAVQFDMQTFKSFNNEKGSLTWILDEFGKAQSEFPATNDYYKMHQPQLPDPKEVYLGALPPIVTTKKSLGQSSMLATGNP